MSVRAVAQEAWRDTISGTSRAGLLALVFAFAVGVIAALDVRVVVDVLQRAATFRTSGAATQVLKPDHSVNGANCDALIQVSGIDAAGAIRRGQQIRFLAMPSPQFTVVEATPGLIDMLPLIAQPYVFDPTVLDGVWLSVDLARDLSVAPGGSVQTSAGELRVAGIYTWPEDGRTRDLGYNVVVPVTTDEEFAQCWAQIWPADATLSSLLLTSLTSTDSRISPTVGQLNVKLGASFDATALLTNRLTAVAPWIAALVGLALGYTALRLRRVEVASALHARVPRAQLTLQHLMETAIWASAAAVISAAALLWVARAGNPDPSWATWLIGLRAVVAGVSGALLGTILGVTSTREEHLFRYAKDR
jgi:hypothetical protein